jgi:two-component system sensor histidine kinase FlrB
VGRKGSGLGLAIARAIADAHGGELTLRSTPGEGATLTIVLPVS